MKLLRLKADGFGPLRGEYRFDPARVTLLVGSNERGKSSLLAAITAGLYGLSDDRRTHRVMTPVERWRPWDGGSYRLELELEMDGQQYSIRRDFDENKVEVWNGDGREVTAEFQHEKGEFPIGLKLLGIDAVDWEKCAFIRQNDLAEVVPTDEKSRRSSSLRARLENAADTHGGDTNATEAVRVIDHAASNYTCDELGSTMKVENVIKALEAKRGLIEADIKALENQLEQISGPLEELARRGDEERRARTELEALEAERRFSRGAEIRAQIEANEEKRGEIEKLRKEAEELAAVAELPSTAEAELRETIARHEEAQRNLDALEARRRDETEREKQSLDKELEEHRQYENTTPDDADRFVALAGEMKRIGETDSRLKDSVFSQREALASRGYEPERIQQLTQRFEGLTDEQQRLLRTQAERALSFQTEVAELEQKRTRSTETLRDIDVARNRRRTPGWFMLALGLGGAAAGLAVMLIGGLTTLYNGLLIGGTILVALGGAFVTSATRARGEDRETALRELSEAQRRLNQIKAGRAEAEVGINEMCRNMGYRDPVELMREWAEWSRLMEDSAPVLRAQEGIAALEAQRKAVIDEVRELLDRVGGGSPDPTNLERVATGIRHYWVIRSRLDDLDQAWSWIDDEKRVAEAAATGLKERAIRILQSAGLQHDPERAWVDHVHELSRRLQDKSRYVLLQEELIPQAERRLLTDEQLEDKKHELALLEADHAEAVAEGEAPKTPRSQSEIEKKMRTIRDHLESVQKWRADLRIGVEEAWRRHHREHPEKVAELERVDGALRRAQRFQHATDLARETIQKVAVSTHRRWAEHLNQRVTELVSSVGTGITEVRFGDDLDFSVRYGDGRQVARGKALLQMSSGALDQLHLAVRLAISEYLSRGNVALPLLLDDAFATSDDERTDAAMRLIVEHFSAQHQVLVVTCHKSRFESLAAGDPELYGRVQRIDLAQPAGTAG